MSTSKEFKFKIGELVYHKAGCVAMLVHANAIVNFPTSKRDMFLCVFQDGHGLRRGEWFTEEELSLVENSKPLAHHPV